VRTVNIQIGDAKFSAALMTDKAPKTCEALTKILPIETEILHTRYSDEAMWVGLDNAPKIDFENHTSYASKGDLLFYAGTLHRSGILLAYGASVFSTKVGVLPGNHFASVMEGVDKLPETGMKLLREGAKTIRIAPEN
jgi:hypothetical protein